MEDKELIIKVLSETDKPLKPGEIAEKAGVDRKEVDKWIKKLVKEELIHSPIRCAYALKQ